LPLAEMEPVQHHLLYLNSAAQLYSVLSLRVTEAVTTFGAVAWGLASSLCLNGTQLCSVLLGALLRAPLPFAVAELQATATFASSALAASAVSSFGSTMSEVSSSLDTPPPLHTSHADVSCCAARAARTTTHHRTPSDASSPPCYRQSHCARRALRLVGGGDTLPEQRS